MMVVDMSPLAVLLWSILGLLAVSAAAVVGAVIAPRLGAAWRERTRRVRSRARLAPFGKAQGRRRLAFHASR